MNRFEKTMERFGQFVLVAAFLSLLLALVTLNRHALGIHTNLAILGDKTDNNLFSSSSSDFSPAFASASVSVPDAGSGCGCPSCCSAAAQ